MPKAGLFAGEVTQAAPADGAATLKNKGYQWMEYGSVASVGLCGLASNLNQADALSAGSIQTINQLSHTVNATSVYASGLTMNDTTTVCFTAAFVRGLAPAAGKKAYMMEVTGPSSEPILEYYINENGHIRIYSENIAGTTILDITITNNGGSFIGDQHFVTMVFDVTDPANREVYVDAIDVTENTGYTTYTTYENLTIELEATAISDRSYSFGLGLSDGHYGTSNPSPDIDSLGFITFDDTCSLIGGSVWDISGNIRDPQKWSGWYLNQPQIFFGPTFWRNTGKLGNPVSYSSTALEKKYDVSDDFYLTDSEQTSKDEKSLYNDGVA
jgi:hypothetical protein